MIKSLLCTCVCRELQFCSIIHPKERLDNTNEQYPGDRSALSCDFDLFFVDKTREPTIHCNADLRHSPGTHVVFVSFRSFFQIDEYPFARIQIPNCFVRFDSMEPEFHFSGSAVAVSFYHSLDLATMLATGCCVHWVAIDCIHSNLYVFREREFRFLQLPSDNNRDCETKTFSGTDGLSIAVPLRLPSIVLFEFSHDNAGTCIYYSVTAQHVPCSSLSWEVRD